MQRNLIIAGMASLALLTPEAARACTVSEDWNSYESFLAPDPAEVLRNAATVDWVRIKERGGYTCRKAAASADCPNEDRLAAPFWAEVREHLKGRSPARYTLHQGRDTSNDESPVVAPLRLLADVRGQSMEDRLYFAAQQKSEAEGRHRALRDWHAQGIAIAGFPGPSNCGGTVAAVDPRLSYLVFRDGEGAVTGLVPVAYEDDEWLQRLRRHADDPAAFARAEAPVTDLFQMVDRVAVGQITDCPRHNWNVRLLRGDIGKMDPGDDPRYAFLQWSFVDDFFRWRKQACPTGATVLIYRVIYPGKPEQNLSWARSEIPEMTDAEFRAIERREAGRRYWKPDNPGIVIVRDGKVRLKDFMTDLTLSGPAEISVDQVFAWAGPDGAEGEPQIVPTAYAPARADSAPTAVERWRATGIGLVPVLSALGVFGLLLGLRLWLSRRRA